MIDLEKDRKFLLGQEAKLEDELNQVKRKHVHEMEILRGKLRQAEEQRDKDADMIAELREERRRLRKAEMALEIQLRNAKIELDIETSNLRNELEHAKKNESISAAPVNISPTPSSPPLSKSDTGDILERLHKLETVNRRLTYENRVLAESNANAKIVEEKLHTYERRMDQYRQIEDQYNELLGRVNENVQRVTKETPTKEIRELMEKTATLFGLQEQHVELKAKYDGIARNTEELQMKNDLLTSQNEVIKKSHEENLDELLRLRQQMAVSKTEIELLKEQLQVSAKIEKTNASLLKSLQNK